MPDLDEDTPCAFRAHPELPPLWAKWMRELHRQALELGKKARAEVLARLAASEVVVKFAKELARNTKKPRKPLRETALATMWHHPTARSILEQMLQLPEGPCFSVVFEQLDRNEDLVRCALALMLLERLATLAAQPLNRPLQKARELRDELRAERKAARVLRRQGLDKQAERYAKAALLYEMLLRRALAEAEQDTGFQNEEDRLCCMIREAFEWLWDHFRFTAADGIVAGLIAAALQRPLKAGQVRHLVAKHDLAPWRCEKAASRQAAHDRPANEGGAAWICTRCARG